MSHVEAHVCAILDTMANATVSEMTKVIGGSDSTRPEVTPSAAENKHDSSDEKVH